MRRSNNSVGNTQRSQLVSVRVPLLHGHNLPRERLVRLQQLLDVLFDVLRLALQPLLVRLWGAEGSGAAQHTRAGASARAFSLSNSSSQFETASRSSLTSAGLAWCTKLRAQTDVVKARARWRAGQTDARSAHALVGVARLGKRVQLRQREDAALPLLFARAALHSHLRTSGARASAALPCPTGRS